MSALGAEAQCPVEVIAQSQASQSPLSSPGAQSATRKGTVVVCTVSPARLVTTMPAPVPALGVWRTSSKPMVSESACCDSAHGLASRSNRVDLPDAAAGESEAAVLHADRDPASPCGWISPAPETVTVPGRVKHTRTNRWPPLGRRELRSRVTLSMRGWCWQRRGTTKPVSERHRLCACRWCGGVPTKPVDRGERPRA